MMNTAFIFPGQGSQKVGMGEDLAYNFPSAKNIFEEVNDALDRDLFQLMISGSEKELTQTENAQPAILAHGLAIINVLKTDFGFNFINHPVSFVAGHSVGEYTALGAVDMFSVYDAAQLLQVRGLAMRDAFPPPGGAMVALIGGTLETAQKIISKTHRAITPNDVCVIANDNAPDQVVISGNQAAMELASNFARDEGIKRAIFLPVSGPFHCPLMESAAHKVADKLNSIKINKPILPLVSNVTACEVINPSEIQQLLIKQITHTVRWRECILYLETVGVTNIVEIGGTVLSNLVKRINRKLTCVSVTTPQEIESFMKGK